MATTTVQKAKETFERLGVVFTHYKVKVKNVSAIDELFVKKGNQVDFDSVKEHFGEFIESFLEELERVDAEG